jgi:TolB protein
LAWVVLGSTFDLVLLSPVARHDVDDPGVVIPSSGTDDLQPAWSPDGRRLAFIRSPVGGDSQIAVLDIATRAVVSLTRPPSGDFDLYPSWTPDGKTIVFARNADGGASARLMRMSANGSNLRDISPFDGNFGAVRISPSGRQLVFGYECAGNWDIYTMSIDGQHARRLTDSPGNDLLPAWSPDGRAIVFSSDRTAPHDPASLYLYVMRVDGSGQTRIPKGGDGGYPAWGPTP